MRVRVSLPSPNAGVAQSVERLICNQEVASSILVASSIKFFKKVGITPLKQISNEEMKKLINNKYVCNSNKGFVDKNRNTVGFYRTRNKRYIEDKFVDIAKKLP